MPRSYSRLVCETDNFVTMVQIHLLAPDISGCGLAGKAPVLGTGNRTFESCHPDQYERLIQQAFFMEDYRFKSYARSSFANWRNWYTHLIDNQAFSFNESC